MKRPVGEVSDDPFTPECRCCGDLHIGVAEDAFLCLRGQWMPSVEFAHPIFVFDPDTQVLVVELANGQLALITDVEGHPTLHVHKECMEQIIREELDDVEEDEE